MSGRMTGRSFLGGGLHLREMATSQPHQSVVITVDVEGGMSVASDL